MSQCEPASGHHCIQPSINPSIHLFGPFSFSPLRPQHHNPCLGLMISHLDYCHSFLSRASMYGLVSSPFLCWHQRDLSNLKTSCSCSKNIQGSPRQSCNILTQHSTPFPFCLLNNPSHFLSHILLYSWHSLCTLHSLNSYAFPTSCCHLYGLFQKDLLPPPSISCLSRARSNAVFSMKVSQILLLGVAFSLPHTP